MRNPTLPPPPDVRFFVWTLDSHTLYGPLRSAASAHAFAKIRGLTSYQLMTSNNLTDRYLENLIVVTEKRKRSQP